MSQSINLEYTKVEPLPDNTQCYQLDNGAIVFFKSDAPQRLYVRAKGFGHVGPDASLPSGHFTNVTAHGNAVHIVTPFGSLYRATVAPENTVNVSHVRQLLSSESVEASGALCSRVVGSLKQVYRLGRDSEGESICDTTGSSMLMAIHRDKLISVRCQPLHFGAQTEQEHSIRAVNASALVIEIPLYFESCRVFARDPSPIIYVSKQDCLFAFNTETMGAQPIMRLNGVTNLSVFGVGHGVIVLTGKHDGQTYMLEAKVPDAEFKIPDPNAQPDLAKCVLATTMSAINKDQTNRQAVKRVVDNSQIKKSNYCNSTEWIEFKTSNMTFGAWKRKRMVERVAKKDVKPLGLSAYVKKVCAGRAREQEYIETVNDLLDKNAELSKQIERQCDYGTVNDQCAKDFHKNNSELEKSNTEQEKENRNATENLQRRQRLNDEIEAANDQLTEEHEMMVAEVEKAEKQMSEKIRKLQETNSKLTVEREQLRNTNNIDVTVTVSKSSKEDLRSRLELMKEENKKLVTSLFERRIQSDIKKVLEENELAIKMLDIKC